MNWRKRSFGLMKIVQRKDCQRTAVFNSSSELLIWGFLEIGVPTNHPFLWDLPYKPSSYWGTPTLGNHHFWFSTKTFHFNFQCDFCLQFSSDRMKGKKHIFGGQKPWFPVDLPNQATEILISEICVLSNWNELSCHATPEWFRDFPRKGWDWSWYVRCFIGQCHPTPSPSVYGGFQLGKWGIPKLAGQLISWKIPSFEMDDDWGYPVMT